MTTTMTEREKMLTGKPYLAMGDIELIKSRLNARRLLQRYNNYPWPSTTTTVNPNINNPSTSLQHQQQEEEEGNLQQEEEEDILLDDIDYFGPDERRNLLAKLFNISLDHIKLNPIEIEPPFFCDYGSNIIFNGPFYCNFNCHILDCSTVTFGSRVICGPNVQIYAGTHSTDITERQKGLERAYPIEIGDDVWIGGGAIVIGPCTIGNGTTVAAGAVVRGDIPANVVVGGIPARIIKHLNNNNSSKSEHSTAKPDHQSSGFDSKISQSKLSTTNTHHSKSNYKSGGSKATVTGTDDDHPSSAHSEEQPSDPLVECFLANIPNTLSSSTLQSALAAFGEVKSLTLDRARRLGFVRFSTAQAAEDAVEAGQGPDGFVVVINEETNEKMVVGVERRRLSDSNRTFNPDLITSTRCLIRRLPNTVDFDELRLAIEEKAGPLVEWNVQDFTSPDPTKPSVDKFISLEFERLCGAREAVRLSQSVNGGIGGIEVPGADGLKARVEARKQFAPQSNYRGNNNNYRGGGHFQGYHQTGYVSSHYPRSNRGGSSYGASSGYHHTHPTRGTPGGQSHYNSNYHHHNHHHQHSSKNHSQPFNGSFSKWKPRRSNSGALVGSE